MHFITTFSRGIRTRTRVVLLFIGSNKRIINLSRLSCFCLSFFAFGLGGCCCCCCCCCFYPSHTLASARLPPPLLFYNTFHINSRFFLLLSTGALLVGREAVVVVAEAERPCVAGPWRDNRVAVLRGWGDGWMDDGGEFDRRREWIGEEKGVCVRACITCNERRWLGSAHLVVRYNLYD